MNSAFATLPAGTLIARTSGPKVMITNESGGSAIVTIAVVNQSNGVMHVVNNLLLPK